MGRPPKIVDRHGRLECDDLENDEIRAGLASISLPSLEFLKICKIWAGRRIASPPRVAHVIATHPALSETSKLDTALAEVLEGQQLRRLRKLKLTRLELLSHDDTEIPLWVDFKKTIKTGQSLGVVVETYKNNSLFNDKGMVVLKGGEQ